MIVGTLNFDKAVVTSLADDYEGMCKYVRGLVPEILRHVDAIYNNTRYYISYEILKDTSIKLDLRQQISNQLTRNIHVVGQMGRFIPCEQIISLVSREKLIKYYRGDFDGKGS